MAAREEVKEDNHRGRGVFHYGMDDIPHYSHVDNSTENMGPLQYTTNFEGEPKHR